MRSLCGKNYETYDQMTDTTPSSHFQVALDLIGASLKENHLDEKTRKKIDKILATLQKAHAKDMRKPKRKASNDPPKTTGFFRPVKISAELASFLEVAHDEPIQRTLIIKKVYEYIKAHELMSKDKSRCIVVDGTLEKLFGPAIHPVKKGEDVMGYSFYNINIYLRQHIHSNSIEN